MNVMLLYYSQPIISHVACIPPPNRSISHTNVFLFCFITIEFNQGSVGSHFTHDLSLFCLLCGCKNSIKSS